MDYSKRDGRVDECFTHDMADMIAAGVLRRSHAMARPFQVSYDPHCGFCKKNRLIVLINEEYEHPEPTFIRRLPVSVAALSYDQTFPGRSVVILRDHVTDLNELMKYKQMLFMAFMEDVSATVDALKVVCNPDRMNYAIYMNQNEHLHVHLIPRYKREGDAYYGPPPFRGINQMFPDFDYRSLAVRIRRNLKFEQSELSKYCEQLINQGLPP